MLSIGKLEAMTRTGFAARGVLYSVIGYLAIRVGRTEDVAGAMEFVESSPGRAILFVMALGLLGYGIWRVSEAAIDTEGHGADLKGVAERAGGAVSGLLHLGLSYAALGLALGGRSGGGDTAVQGAATALTFPGGAIALLVAAVVLMVTGALQLVKAVRLGFLKYLEPRAAGMAWIKWVGRLGYLARGTVFVIMGGFLWNAGRQASATEAGSMDKALDALPPTLQLVVAGGLFLFGIFSFVEARYRRINDPGVVERIKHAART